MERRMRGNSHVRCEVGENPEYHQGITYHYLHRQFFSEPWSFHLPVRYIFGRYLDKDAGEKVK